MFSNAFRFSYVKHLLVIDMLLELTPVHSSQPTPFNQVSMIPVIYSMYFIWLGFFIPEKPAQV